MGSGTSFEIINWDTPDDLRPALVGCEGGFWIRASDPGFKTNVATVLLAYNSKSALRVWAYNDQLWTGSGAPTCRIHGLGLA